MFNINNYEIIRKDRTNQVGGGLAFCIKRNLQFKKLNLIDRYKEKIETLGLKLNYKDKWLYILLIYNPCNNIETKELEHYIEQLGNPKLIIGDFNSHHPHWNPRINLKLANRTGKNIFELINQKNLILLTPPGQTTKIDPRNGKETTIDLIIGTPNLSHLEINSGPNLTSDHLPIIIKDNIKPITNQKKEKKWIFKEERWKDYKKDLKAKDVTTIKSIEELTDLLRTTGQTYFKFNNENRIDKPNKPWWNNKCKEIIKKRNKAYNKWKKKPNKENQIEYKTLLAKAKQIIDKEKKESWEKFCTSLSFTTPPKTIWNFIKKMNGKTSKMDYPIIINNQPISDQLKKTEIFSKEYQKLVNNNPKKTPN
ncbi:uncharacterized protein LOC122255192 [Penaeus japonicus]|uniref:uncharacterized protein LOC122255192 n=1 Tax=Penaeus japonicus TaxID=27405 RepID=UPI001C713795|nr:uncharacterized protein LOC122255192 [Penaeus japonicus]